ncbi:hypothetical protein B0H13DRAFT_1909550 [Mycena leptocephala]|nr:hypothetical protein B0H13DRAFT_1909550 [Mycena leptocephala]
MCCVVQRSTTAGCFRSTVAPQPLYLWSSLTAGALRVIASPDTIHRRPAQFRRGFSSRHSYNPDQYQGHSESLALVVSRDGRDCQGSTISTPSGPVSVSSAARAFALKPPSLFEGITVQTSLACARFEKLRQDLFHSILEPVDKVLQRQERVSINSDWAAVCGTAVQIFNSERLSGHDFDDSEIHPDMKHFRLLRERPVDPH